MIAQPKTNKKRLILYAVIIIVMIVGNIIIYYGNSGSSEVLVNINNNILETAGTASATPTGGKANGSVLDNKLFKVLEKIGDWPVVPKNIGKANPFSPAFSE
jgi:hypothetical protein